MFDDRPSVTIMLVARGWSRDKNLIEAIVTLAKGSAVIAVGGNRVNSHMMPWFQEGGITLVHLIADQIEETPGLMIEVANAIRLVMKIDRDCRNIWVFGDIEPTWKRVVTEGRQQGWAVSEVRGDALSESFFDPEVSVNYRPQAVKRRRDRVRDRWVGADTPAPRRSNRAKPERPAHLYGDEE